MNDSVASANLPRDINQCELCGSDRRNKKKRRAIAPSVARKSRQFCALFTVFSSASVTAAASNMPTDWQAIVATIDRARLRLGNTSET